MKYKGTGRQLYKFAFELADSRDSILGDLAGRAAAAAENAFLAVLNGTDAQAPEPLIVPPLDPALFAAALSERTLAPWAVHSDTAPDHFTVKNAEGVTVTVFRAGGIRRACAIMGNVVDVPSDPHAAADLVAYNCVPVEILSV